MESKIRYQTFNYVDDLLRVPHIGSVWHPCMTCKKCYSIHSYFCPAYSERALGQYFKISVCQIWGRGGQPVLDNIHSNSWALQSNAILIFFSSAKHCHNQFFFTWPTKNGRQWHIQLLYINLRGEGGVRKRLSMALIGPAKKIYICTVLQNKMFEYGEAQLTFHWFV